MNSASIEIAIPRPHDPLPFLEVTNTGKGAATFVHVEIDGVPLVNHPYFIGGIIQSVRPGELHRSILKTFDAFTRMDTIRATWLNGNGSAGESVTSIAHLFDSDG